MSTGAEKLLAAEEFARIHAGDYVELIDGRVEPIRRAGSRNAVICANLVGVFGGVVYADKSWVMCSNDTFVLTRRNPDRVRGADLVLWRRERIPQPTPDLVPQPPEMVVEVRRPFDTVGDMLAKTAEYLQAEVRVVVVVDPQHEAVIAFDSDALPRTVRIGDELTLLCVLPGFSVPVAKFFE